MPRNVEIHNDTQVAIDQNAVRSAVHQTLRELDAERTWEVSIRIVSDPAMLSLNRTHLKREYPTDVLSFPVFPFYRGKSPTLPPGPLLLGEVVCNIDAAQRAANRAGHSVEREVQSLVAHGVRHLIGFHHE